MSTLLDKSSGIWAATAGRILHDANYVVFPATFSTTSIGWSTVRTQTYTPASSSSLVVCWCFGAYLYSGTNQANVIATLVFPDGTTYTYGGVSYPPAAGTYRSHFSLVGAYQGSNANWLLRVYLGVAGTIALNDGAWCSYNFLFLEYL